LDRVTCPKRLRCFPGEHMNISEYRLLSEALKRWEDYEPVVSQGARDELTPIFDAARLTYDRYQECDYCGGRQMVHTDKPGKTSPYPCPSCEGRGIRPNQTRVEQAADTFGEWLYRMHGTISSCDHHDETSAVVRAFDKETQ